MTPKFRRGARAALRTLVVGATLLFLLKGVPWEEVVGTLRTTNVFLLVGVVAVNACMMALKAGRLRLLLRRIPSFKSCFLAKLTTSALNNVVPFRGGDMARVWMLERHAGITKSAAAAVAIVEALFELLALAAVTFAAAMVAREQRWVAGTAASLVGAAVVLIWLLKRVKGGAAAQLTRASGASGVLAWIRGVADRVEPATRALRSPDTIAVAVASSLIIWVLEMSMVMLCARAIHLSIGPALATVTLMGINLAMALPSMPASVGAFESGATLVLVISGIAKGPAVAFALLYHAIQVVPVTIVGLGVISRVGITLDRLPAPQSAE
jgi:hypothetical protein